MSELATEISAVRASKLVHVSAKTIYKWIREGKLDARKVQRAGEPWTYMVRLDDLANIPGVTLDHDLLQQLAVPAVEQRLEAWMRHMDERLNQLEKRMPAYEQELLTFKAEIRRVLQAAQQAPHAALPSPLEVSASSMPFSADDFPTKKLRAQWLALHGWPEGTTKTWDGCPMGPPEAVLQWAWTHNERIGYRAGPRRQLIGQCDVAECPCHALMANG